LEWLKDKAASVVPLEDFFQTDNERVLLKGTDSVTKPPHEQSWYVH